MKLGLTNIKNYNSDYKIMTNNTEKSEQIALAERIREAISNLPWGGKTQLADKCKVSLQAINGWTKTGKIGKLHLAVIANETGHSLNWLITGKGDKKYSDAERRQRVLNAMSVLDKSSNQALTDSNATYLGTIAEWDSQTPLGEDDIALPFFREVELAAGDGRSQVQENHGCKLRFSKSTLKRQGIDAHNAYCVTVSGNSMEPMMPEGAVVGVNTSETKIKNGKIYAIDHNGYLRVKMLYVMPDNSIRIRSYNSDEWPDEFVSGDALNTLKIIGRVFYYSCLI